MIIHKTKSEMMEQEHEIKYKKIKMEVQIIDNKKKEEKSKWTQ